MHDQDRELRVRRLAHGLVTWPWEQGGCSGKCCYLFPGPRMCVSVNVGSKGTVLVPGTGTVQRIVAVRRQITTLFLHSFFQSLKKGLSFYSFLSHVHPHISGLYSRVFIPACLSPETGLEGS